ncbi:MAG: CRISPR-associated endonuclease Cas3'', partial [Rubrivivax sp.]|nr:CRISPR-associated endonuclease Cas3'' [Rubrivivax sp.]
MFQPIASVATPAASRFDGLSPGARAIWAKSGDGERSAIGHGLLAHMLDVAAVAQSVLELESPQTLAWAAAAFGLPLPGASRWIAVMVGLHDLGKAIPGFQAKWAPGQAADERAGLPFRPADAAKSQHDLASAYELQRLLAGLTGSPARARAVAGAVAAHHGHVFDSTTVHDARRPSEHAAWASARAEIFAAYVGALAPQAVASDVELTLPALAWLAGLTALADWVGSNTDWFKPGERAETLTGHHAAALTLAQRALAEIGWPTYRPLLQQTATANELVARIVGQPAAAARPLQSAAD